MANLIGTNPDQISVNGMLGTMAFQDAKAISIGLGMVGPVNAANQTRFPNALLVSSNTSTTIQQNESHNIGILGEGTANSTNTAIYGVGVYGVGYTAAATRCGGVIGEGHVSASADTGSAIGVRGYANDTHSGGLNIGLLGEVSGSAIGNYALYSNTAATDATYYSMYLAGTAPVYITGSLGVGATAVASAILDAQSTTKGVRFPNMTTTQKNAIVSPAAGLVVFDTTLAKLCVYTGAAWQTITSA